MSPAPGDSILLSAIEHHAYCPRQAALIHVDAEWVPNAHTAQGDADHAALDRSTHGETRGTTTTWYSLPVWNDDLGIHGFCDAVDMTDGLPTPIEHKPALSTWSNSPAQQQLAAQAMCLESMWGIPVQTGVLFTRKDRQRHFVQIDLQLRAATRHTIEALHDLLDQRRLPPPVNDRRCDRCSLRTACKGDTPPIHRDPFAVTADNNW